MFGSKLDPVISPTTHPIPTPQDTLVSPKCVNCNAKFGFLKSRKICLYCQLAYCRDCIKSCERNVYKITHNASRVQPSLVPVKACVCCLVLSSPDSKLDEVMKIDVRHLKLYLSNKSEQITGLKEKTELAEQVLKVNRRNIYATSPRNSHAPLPNSMYTNARNQQTPTNYNTQPQYQSMFNLNSNSPTSSPTNQSANQPTPEQQRAFEILNDILGRQFYTMNTRGSEQSQSSNSTNSEAPENRPPSQPTVNRVRSNSGEHGVTLTDPTMSSATSTPNIKDASPTVSRRRASLSDLKSEEDIEKLTIRQIKEILAFNFVDYKGCFERSELVQKLKVLYASNVANQKLLSEMNESPPKATSKSTQNLDMDESAGSEKPPAVEVCKICMDNAIDCVLLNCGHMVSCVKCGKVLAECPICRQNIVKVVRVFKA